MNEEQGVGGPGELTVTRYYRVFCGCCQGDLDFEHFAAPGETQADVTRLMRGRGWSHTKAHGWVGPCCNRRATL